MSRKLLQTCLKHVQSALKAATLYPSGHPGIEGPLRDFVRGIGKLLEAGHAVVLGIVDDVLVFDEIPFYETEGTWRPLYRALRNRKLESITFMEGFTSEEMVGILEILRGPRDGDPDDLAAAWKARGIVHASFRELIEAEDIRARAHQTYHESLGVVVELFSEIRMGKVPSGPAAVRVIDGMQDIVLQDRNALLGMAMMKSYDAYTFNHSVNTSIFCLSLGAHLELPPEEFRALGLAGLLHDMGKVRTDEAIIKKPGALDEQEMRLMRLHPELGVEILQSMKDMRDDAMTMVLQHHVRFDRQGYPRLPVGTEIHPLSEAIGLADCYDALTTTRPYQRARHPGEAMRIIRRGAGSAYAPELVEKFLAMLGTYPIGELVRLATGELAVVVATNPRDATAPVVRLVMDRDGLLLPRSRRVELADPAEAARQIVARVDPTARAIDIAGVLEEESEA
ncbi:MAG: HD-GYP domain-containing protein [Myxococcota bacterium]